MNCRACNSPYTEHIFSLGNQPLANSLLTEEQLTEAEDFYPLEVVFCNACSLVQLEETVPKEKMFSEYLYLSSFSPALVEQARHLVARMANRRDINLVVEIGSNDGYLLQHYKALEIPVLGIEPAENVAAIAEQKGIFTIKKFFTQKLAEEIVEVYDQATIIHANNVFAHNEDVHDFIEGLKTLLAPNGVAVIEVHYVKSIAEKFEFDTIYHEHVFYFSLTSLSSLFNAHNMVIQNVEVIPMHGGSLRIFVGHEGVPSSEVLNLLDEENKGLVHRWFYYNLTGKVPQMKFELVDLLTKLKKEGKKVAGFGAAAKATVLLNFYGIGTDLLEYVADESYLKQGKYIPGVRIPVVPPSVMEEDNPDYVLILCWNFAQGVMDKYPQFKGRFIIPIPKVEVI